MSDKAKLKAIFDERGIGYLENSDYPDLADNRHKNILFLKEGMDRVEGYFGFWTAFVFNDTDELVNIEVYE